MKVSVVRRGGAAMSATALVLGGPPAVGEEEFEYLMRAMELVAEHG